MTFYEDAASQKLALLCLFLLYYYTTSTDINEIFKLSNMKKQKFNKDSKTKDKNRLNECFVILN